MPTYDQSRLRSGDVVIVRPPDEILSTLDANGTTADLPFMPEMVDSCGKLFRVSRRIEKTCVEGQLSRRFGDNDVVLLEAQRCNGAAHDGCKRGCMIFWKESWLRRAEDGESNIEIKANARERLLAQLKVRRDAAHYFCQSTELLKATEDFQGKYKPWMVRIAFREVLNGDRSPLEMARILAQGVNTIIQRRRVGFAAFQLLPGPNKRTPTESLGLKPGDWVRIKSEAEILKTLDGKSRNRGLTIARAMIQNCGKRFEVGENFDQMINERNGEMLSVKNTVTLKGLECHCAYKLGGCPRGELQYWREIWLERSPS